MLLAVVVVVVGVLQGIIEYSASKREWVSIYDAEKRRDVVSGGNANGGCGGGGGDDDGLI